MKKCCTCGEVKALGDFHRSKQCGDGRRPNCKVCQNLVNAKSYKKYRLKRRNANKIYRETHKDLVRERQKRWVKQNPDKVRAKSTRTRERHLKEYAAREKVARASKSGKLVRSPCKYPGCGAILVGAHHWDYDDPLEVVWLCKKHHALADRVRRAILLTV